MVDRFSKTVHFIPFPKLPSARETARVVADHVFRIHCLPEDVVSDRGPSSCPIFGGSSVSSWVPPSVCTQGSIHRRTARQNVQTRISSRCSDVWPPKTPLPGVSSLLGLSMPISSCSSTGFPPFMCCLNYQPPLLTSQGAEAAVPLVQGFIQHCVIPLGGPGRHWSSPRGLLKAAAETVALRYICGQKVWLSTKHLSCHPGSLGHTPSLRS